MIILYFQSITLFLLKIIYFSEACSKSSTNSGASFLLFFKVSAYSCMKENCLGPSCFMILGKRSLIAEKY